MRSVDEHLARLREQLKATKERLDFFTHRGAGSKQEEVLVYFLERTSQLGEARFAVGQARLRIAFFVLMRVICEDLFLAYWVSISTKNADQYAQEVRSELSRLLKINLDRGRGKLVDRKTGKDRTAEVISEIGASVTPKKDRLSTERLAIETGLGKVYDTAYRFASLEVHGKMFGLKPKKGNDEAIAAALPGITSMLRAVLFLVDRRLADRDTAPAEILRILNIEHIAGN
jgi:uncharacterized protein DUF5677